MTMTSGAHPRPLTPEQPRPKVFSPGTPIGLHLRVERVVRQTADRTYYLVNNSRPRWYTRKCWECGNKHSEPTAQACSYCSAPLKLRRLMMTARWNPASSLTYQAYVHRRLRYGTLAHPLALYRYHEQLLAFFDWDQDNLLINEPAPLPANTLLSIGFQLADALSFLHAYGIVLGRVTPSNVLVAPDGHVRLFDLEVDRLVDRPIQPTEDLTAPPFRDLRDVASMLQSWCGVEDEDLRSFLKSVRRGAYGTADELAAGISQFAWDRRTEAPPSIAAAQSDAGVVRGLNEDDYAWRSVGGGARLYCVADGMGGHNHGDVASSLATRTMCRTMQRRWSETQKAPAGLEGLLREAFSSANAAVCAVSDERREAMGTTLVAMLQVDGKTALVGNVGDSRCYLLRGGELTLITEDHSMVAAMMAAGKITAEEARNHPKSNVLLNYLGSTRNLEADVFTVKVQPGDRFLLCSDGLWGEVQDTMLARILGSDPDPRRVVRRLVRAANDAGGRDNITAVVVDLPFEAAPPVPGRVRPSNWD